MVPWNAFASMRSPIPVYLSLDDSVCKSYFRRVMFRERIVVYEDGADLLRDAVVREREAQRALEEVSFRGTGPESGDWEDCMRPVYIPPQASN